MADKISMAQQGKLVYSTGQGRLCPECGRAVAGCSCKRSKPASGIPAPAGDGIVRVGRETKGRKGKGVTIITGVPLAGDALGELATRLKKRCGSGGTVNARTIEIQGDHRDLLVEELGKLGYTVRRSGG
jgi:translation initiation factor 1